MMLDCIFQITFTVDRKSQSAKSVVTTFGLVAPCIAASGLHDKMPVCMTK